MNLFELTMERFKFGKTINIVECFAGIGTQAMAWKLLLKKYNIKLNFMAISEIDKHALQSYKAIHGEFKNLGGVGDFERFPKGIDFCSWSFPCQDISLAGEQKGMVDGSRSNYGYVFLDTIANTPKEERPKVLLMENVPSLISETFKQDYAEIHNRLEAMGYTSWGGLLNAKGFGIPQNRERIFVLSILGEYSYTFPQPFELTKKLKDLLEDEVDEKYFITETFLNYLTKIEAGQFNRRKRFEVSLRATNLNGIASTITTNPGRGPYDNYIIIPEATQKGYALAEVGDGVYLNRPHQKRGVVQKEMIPTLTTSHSDIGVVVKVDVTKQVEVMMDNGEILSGEQLAIRRLTPLETWRLMGISDEDFNKAKASGVSNAQLYKQAGNAIVVNVLEKIFEQLLDNDLRIEETI